MTNIGYYLTRIAGLSLAPIRLGYYRGGIKMINLIRQFIKRRQFKQYIKICREFLKEQDVYVDNVPDDELIVMIINGVKVALWSRPPIKI